MTFNFIETLKNRGGIPGIPNSSIIDPFGIGIAPRVLDMLSGGVSTVKEVTKNLPYIIIGGGTLFLIILLKR
jgi:hypothetical protein